MSLIVPDPPDTINPTRRQSRNKLFDISVNRSAAILTANREVKKKV